MPPLFHDIGKWDPTSEIIRPPYNSKLHPYPFDSRIKDIGL